MVLALLDCTLTALHGGIVLANLTLWIWHRTRRLHLLVVTCTALSWFGLGLFYGVGYCFLTDWHWSIKRARGEHSLPGSFIHYALHDGLGLALSPATTNWLTAGGFALAVLLSVALNFRDWRRSKQPL